MNTTYFKQSVAIVIGIDQYTRGIPSLRTAVRDARRLGELLCDNYGYDVIQYVDEAATRVALHELFANQLPAQLTADDRLLIYFAGHGLAAPSDGGPTGFLVPCDARDGDYTSMLPMLEIQKHLATLPCRHLFLILDCCFAGAFRWASGRNLRIYQGPLYKERFARFVDGPAWQVITSAADDQQAADVLWRYGTRDDDQEHSPFARALFRGLDGDADLESPQPDGTRRRDGVITATELYLYLRDVLEPETIARNVRQTPGLWQLSKHGKGEFLFWNPRRTLALEPQPELNTQNNPYRGLEPFEAKHANLFFGRQQLIAELQQQVEAQPLTIVLGPSGTGKSSLVKAGLLPLLSLQPHAWHVLAPIRPTAMPLGSLDSLPLPSVSSGSFADRVAAWVEAHPGIRLVLTIDQCEELVTLCKDVEQREAFLQALADALIGSGDQLRLVLTLRTDFEPQIGRKTPLATWWQIGRFFVSSLSPDELRDVVVGPATVRMLVFENDDLIDQIVSEVVQMPGALPLLSFTLSELYSCYLKRQQAGATDRTLRQVDYKELGGVVGALQTRADAEFTQLDEAHQAIMQRVLLRMVALEGGLRARRRVSHRELVYLDDRDNTLVTLIIENLTQARLIVASTYEDQSTTEASASPGDFTYVEPAHDALIFGWARLSEWIEREQNVLLLQRRLTAAALDWQNERRSSRLLWDDNPRLPLVQVAERQAPGVIQRFWRDLTNQQPTPVSWVNRLEHAFVLASGRQRTRVRQRLVVILTAIIGIFAFLALVAWIQRGAALTQQALAEANANARATAQAQAEANANARATAQAEAEFQASQALSIAWTNTSQRIDSAAPDLALALAVQAASIGKPPPLAQQQLADIGYRPGIRSVLQAGHTQRVWSVASANGLMLSGGQDGQLIVWDAVTGHLIRHMQPKSGSIWSVAISANGKVAVAGSNDHSVTIWDIQTGRLLHRFVQHDQAVHSVGISADGRVAISSGADGRIVLWNVAAGQSLRELTRQDDSVLSVAINADASVAVSGGADGRLIMWRVSDGANIKTFTDHTDAVLSVALSADGQTMVSGSADHSVIIWNAQKGALHKLTGHTGSVWAVALSRDGSTIASGSSDRQILLWDVHTGQLLKTLSGHQGAINDLEIYEDGSRILSASDDSSLIVWDRTSGNEQFRLAGHTSAIETMAISANGRVVASQDTDGHLFIWNAATGTTTRAFQLADPITSMALSADGRLLLTGDSSGHVTLRQTDTGDLFTQHDAHRSRVQAVALSEDGRIVFSGAANGTLIMWDTQSGKQVPLPVQQSAIQSVALSADGSVAISGTRSGEVIQWVRQYGAWSRIADETRFSEPIRTVDLSGEGTQALALSEDGDLYLSIGGQTQESCILRQPIREAAFTRTNLIIFKTDGDTIGTCDLVAHKVNDLASLNTELRQQMSSQTIVPGLAVGKEQGVALVGLTDGKLLLVNPDPGYIVTRSRLDYVKDLLHQPITHIFRYEVTGNVNSIARDDAGTVLIFNESISLIPTVFDTRKSEDLYSLHGHSEAVTSVDISADGNTAISGSTDKTVILWDLVQRDVQQRFVGHDGIVRAIALSRDGRWAISGGDDASVIIWDAGTASIAHQFRGHKAVVLAVAFNENGDRVASGSADGEVIIWDVANGRMLFTLTEHTGAVHAVAFSPDGQFVLSGGEDKTILLWDAHTGQLLRRFEGHQAAVYSINFAEAPSLMSSNDADGEIITWRIDKLAQLLDWVKVNRTVRAITCEERSDNEILPLCDELGNLPPSPTPQTPTTPLPTATPIAVLPTVTPRPTVLPTLAEPSTWYWGAIQVDRPKIWHLEGPKQSVQIQVKTESINFQLSVEIRAPNGSVIDLKQFASQQCRPNVSIGPIELPETGMYSIIVKGCDGTAGPYNVMFKNR